MSAPICCFCGQPCEQWHAGSTGYGNNPAPVNNNEDARCCNSCNDIVVIPARLSAFRREA